MEDMGDRAAADRHPGDDPGRGADATELILVGSHPYLLVEFRAAPEDVEIVCSTWGIGPIPLDRASLIDILETVLDTLRDSDVA